MLSCLPVQSESYYYAAFSGHTCIDRVNAVARFGGRDILGPSGNRACPVRVNQSCAAAAYSVCGNEYAEAFLTSSSRRIIRFVRDNSDEGRDISRQLAAPDWGHYV